MHGLYNQTIDWNDINITKLKTMWAAGNSHSQIASVIPNASRSAIAGKIMRLKLPARDKGHASPSPLHRARHATAMTVTQRHGRIEQPQRRNPTNSLAEKIAIAEAEPGLPPILRGEAPDGTGIQLRDLTDINCHWPKGDPLEADFEFCGGKALPGLPYCAHHSRISYAPPRARVAADKWALHRADIKS